MQDAETVLVRWHFLSDIASAVCAVRPGDMRDTVVGHSNCKTLTNSPKDLPAGDIQSRTGNPTRSI